MSRHSHFEPPSLDNGSDISVRATEAALDPRLMGALGDAIDQFVGVASADAAGTITFVNAAFCRLTGYTKAELLGQSCRSFEPRHLAASFAEITSTVSRGQVWRGVLDLRRKDGADLWLAATLAPLAERADPISGYVAVCADITAHELETIAHGERQRRTLAQNAEELRQYARAASHDLQEPLRAIVGCGELLRQEYASAAGDSAARQLLDHVIEGGQRMQELVLALLAYSRVGSCASRRIRSSSRAALDKAVLELAAAVEQTGALIEAGDLPDVSSDPEQLVQLFQHLLDNAIKYHGKDPTVVRVSAEHEGEYFHFRVADNGIGIDPHSQSRVFDLFQRLHARGEYPGLGLGLTVCKKIVEGHGGKIWVDSERGCGATFHFTLPAHDSVAGGEA
jgi:PAS domain S-box-containing protein